MLILSVANPDTGSGAFLTPLDPEPNPLEVFPDPGSSPYFLTSYYHILGEKYLYSLSNDSNLFLCQFKKINIYNPVKIMATEKGKTTNAFSPPLFVVGSEIRDGNRSGSDPG
jgi:hypothetical protein